MDTAHVQTLVDEIERRWRARTPARSVADVDPSSRVCRSEIIAFAARHGIDYTQLTCDNDLDIAIFTLFDRLRREFPNERWEPRRNWTAATKRRRKELGL